MSTSHTFYTQTLYTPQRELKKKSGYGSIVTVENIES